MPTPEEVLSLTQDKIEIYKKALGEIIQQLADKRTEMASLAKKTLKDFENKLVELDENIQKKSSLIKDLDAQISKKQRQYATEESECKPKYDALEKSLRSDYEKKFFILTQKENILAENSNKFTSMVSNKESEYRKREIAIEQQENRIKEIIASLELERAQLEVQKDKFAQDVVKEDRRINASNDQIQSEKIALSLQEKAIEDRRNSLKDLSKLYSDTVNQIETFGNRENEIQKQLKENTKLVEQQNSLSVKNMAEASALRVRKQELEKREKSLDEREANIKILEAKNV